MWWWSLCFRVALLLTRPCSVCSIHQRSSSLRSIRVNIQKVGWLFLKNANYDKEDSWDVKELSDTENFTFHSSLSFFLMAEGCASVFLTESCRGLLKLKISLNIGSGRNKNYFMGVTIRVKTWQGPTKIIPANEEYWTKIRRNPRSGEIY